MNPQHDPSVSELLAHKNGLVPHLLNSIGCILVGVLIAMCFLFDNDEIFQNVSAFFGGLLK